MFFILASKVSLIIKNKKITPMFLNIKKSPEAAKPQGSPSI